FFQAEDGIRDRNVTGVQTCALSDLRLSNRGGKGIKTATITERNGQVVCITSVEGKEDLMIVTNAGVIIRIGVEDISQNGRAAQGVRLIKLNEDQFVSTVAKVDEEEKEAEENELQETDDEVIESTDNASENQQSESVVNDHLSEDIVHTETEDEDETDEDGRQEVREDFMDRINEDIDNEDNDET